MISAVIYDLDDTMVNSDPLHVRAWEELLKEHGHEWAALPQSLRSHFLGMRVVDIVSELADYLKLDHDKDELYKRRVKLFLDIVEKELEPMPGMFSSLKLYKQAGLKLAVASSGAKKYIDLVLDKFDLRDYFDVVITGDDVKVGKPNPEAYLVTAEKLGVSPSDCLVFEDATKGIQSAKAAGCACVAIPSPNVPAQDFSQADLVLDSLEKADLDLLKRF